MYKWQNLGILPVEVNGSMDKAHWILVVGWLLFGLVHSLMAAEWCKAIFRRLMGRRFVYYRLLYAAFAFLSMGAVLYWQFSIKSLPLAFLPILRYLLGLPLGILGLVLMGL